MRRFSHFLRRCDGAIAVEFALVAPVMLGLFFGLIELALAEGARGDVGNLASAGADLVAQESSVTTSDMTNVFNALAAMLYPYATANVRITISSIIDNNSSTSGKVAWSCTQGGTARTAGTTYTFPTAAQGVITSGSGGSVVMAEVTYSYSLPVAVRLPGVINLSGPYTMSKTFYSKPRKVSQIPLASCP
jgi:Flp pilus assembly protein TadG